MNVLFYTFYKVSPTKGGTERTTISIASGLTKFYGYHCFSAYCVAEDTPMEPCFEAELCWKRKDGANKLSSFIKENNIDWIVNQGVLEDAEIIRKASEGTKCKVAIAHHFEPGWEKHFVRFEDFLLSFKKSTKWTQRLKRAIRIIIYPYYRQRYILGLKNNYKKAYLYADRVILLSSGFIPQFMKYAHLKSGSKFQIVPNALSYTEYLSIDKISKKQPIVLIVSRLDETQKRLSLALRIWNEAKKHPNANDWKLIIIGHGRDEQMYHRMISKNNIPDVYLLGRQQPKQYYKEASIFMMTSKSEGWGLTLTEAQQFGVVPIAFNSYVALNDIITDGEDGIVIREGEVNTYIDELIGLISDKKRRERMAVNAIENCIRFSQEEIAKKWYSVFSQDCSNIST